ncbi:MAG: O-antigen ligase family protein [Rhodopirellula sp.]|nr:O-antigen ligase family protein [Rhodopirellula sp.]
MIWGLLLVRWLIPTEGTAGGDTLWLTSLMFAAAAGFFWWMSRVSLERPRFEKIDVAVWFLCGAHILSSLVVIVTEGHKRAATNMLWEWLGVAVMFSLIRQTITPVSRQQFLQSVLVVTTALACYGIWQPTFWYPANLRDYENLRAEIDSVESSSELSAQDRVKRQQELRAQFVSQGIPLSGPSLELFERRLRDSKEPLGFFALTNTFAGFMAMSLVLLAATLLNLLLPAATVSASQSLGTRRRVAIAAVSISILVVAYCLLLTKSRTAWAGTLVGLATLVCLLVVRSRSGTALKKLIPIAAASVIVLSLLTGIAIATGALDVEVLSEASTSLSYRLEYWTSTWDVILDHPLFGTGPGNFRDNYLRYKLPQSSEEISDPHQFVLDVAANAGLIGVIGLLAFLWMIVWLAWRLCGQSESEVKDELQTRSISNDSPPSTSRGAVGVAAAVALAGEWLFSGVVAWQVLCVSLLAIAFDYLLTNVQRRPSSGSAADQIEFCVPSVAIIAALVTLFVHLSAAGGIAMPAVIGLILALAAVLSVDSNREASTGCTGSRPSEISLAAEPASATTSDDPQNGLWLGAALFGGIAAVGCTLTAFGPVIKSASLLQLGDYDAINGQPARHVVRLYRTAAEADPLSPEPYIRLSQFYLHQWKQSRDADFFDQAIENAGKARSLSPHSPQIAHEIGYAWLVKASETVPIDEIAITAATEEMRNTLEMYPTQPTWAAETAQAFALAGDATEAADFAQRALALDEINRAAGHVDRYLPDDLLTEIERIAGTK